MQKTILVVIDGLAARMSSHMGWLAAMVEAGQAQYATFACALPPLSRPLYHCILGGQPPVESGIVCNDSRQRPAPSVASIFHCVAAAGGVTAAAAYSWVCELYNGVDFDITQHRWIDDAALPIQHGVFYADDAYPDSHVFADAMMLEQRWDPTFMLVHPMGVDYAGHTYGGDSIAYRQAVRQMDMLLAKTLPVWTAKGYAVYVTSDHGMHPDGAHNDLDDAVRMVPAWGLGTRVCLPDKQYAWLHTLCGSIGLSL